MYVSSPLFAQFSLKRLPEGVQTKNMLTSETTEGRKTINENMINNNNNNNNNNNDNNNNNNVEVRMFEQLARFKFRVSSLLV